MKQKLNSLIVKIPWKSKLVLSSSTAIFLTFFLFSLLQYRSVSTWMMKQEENSIQKTITDITAFYKQNDNLSPKDIEKSDTFLQKLNNQEQLIRVYDQNGNILVSEKNGDFSVLEPGPEKSSVIERVMLEGHEAIIAKKPINGKHFKGTLEIVRLLNNYHRMMNNLFWGMTVFGSAAILFSAISGYILAKQILTPVREIARTMTRIKKNGFQERMTVYPQKDELSALTKIFNEMMDELEKSFLQQKQFVEDASHELRTPVSILEGHISLLKRWGKKDPAILEESLDASLQEVTRLKKLINDLLTLTRAENHRLVVNAEANVYEIANRLIKNIRMVHSDYQFALDIDSKLPLARISEQHLEQLFIILIDNAVKYSPINKTIYISAREIEEKLLLTIMDKGIGIPMEHVSEVFNRFYRADKARTRENGGTGLGLSIAKELIEKYNGSISIESIEGEGTKVKVILQAARAKEN